MSDEKNLPPGTTVGGAPRHRGRRGLATGVVLILLGLLFLLDNLRLLDFGYAWEMWPLLLVAFGVVRMIDSRGQGSGIWLVVIGLWLFVNEREIWGLTYHDSWPLLVVMIGLSMVWKAVRGGAAPPSAGGSR